MDSTPGALGPASGNDLSALAWVQEELRRSLDAAHKALRRHVKESESLGGSDVDVVDPSVLRSARTHLHQGVGALELVGLPEAATVLRASEAVVQKFVAKPQKLTSLVVEDIEKASFALLDYITRLLAGKPVSALALFPQYKAVAEAQGAERIHPADLWRDDWHWVTLPDDGRVAPRQPDAKTRTSMEAQLLAIMRGGAHFQAYATRLSELCAGLGAGAERMQASTLWKLAAAMFEAQGLGLLGGDIYTKRVASRLLSQFKVLERGESDVSERLAQDLLFFCAQSASPGDGKKAPRLATVRRAYDLAHHLPADYTTSALGRYDPAWIAQARKRVTAAKESWSGVAGGEMHRLSGLPEQFSLVADSLKRLFPHGEALGQALQQAVALTQQGGAAPAPGLAMEVATSLLYTEAALEDAEFDQQGDRVARLAARLDAVRRGEPQQPLEPWMEELYRRVSDRQTMGSVVQELRASLSESEKLIDEFFRNPLDRRVLIPVPNQLSAMRGVLSVLGMDHASAALLRMRDDVDGLTATVVEPEHVQQAGVFDRLAANLGALGFLIDMLSVQPSLAKSLFVYDAKAGRLNPVMGRGPGRKLPGATAPVVLVEPRLIEQAQQLAVEARSPDVPVDRVARDLDRLSHEAQAADQPTLAATVREARASLHGALDEAHVTAVREQLSERLSDFVTSANDAIALEPLPTPPATAPAPAAAVASKPADLAEDDEMREIFLEEAREVIRDASTARTHLVSAPSDLSLLTTVRRAFHTLKGSSRMVGLKDFGEAAWCCEQLYNTQLAEQRAAEPPLLDHTGWVLDYLAAWVEEIGARGTVTHHAAAVKAATERLAGGAPAVVAAPVQAPPPAPAPQPAVTAPVLAQVPAARAEPVTVPAPAPAAPTAPEVRFDLDLGALDAPTTGKVPLNFNDSALQEPFVVHERTEPMPLPEVSEPTPLDEIVPRIDLDFGPSAAAPLAQAVAPPVAAQPEATTSSDDNVKIVGPLRIAIPLFNIYLNEADELSRRLTTEVAEWAMELHRPIGETAVALAHSLAGSSSTVGFADLSHLARSLEHALMRSNQIGYGAPDEARLFVEAAEEIRRLLHQFAAGFLKEPQPALLARLADHERSSTVRLEALSALGERPRDPRGSDSAFATLEAAPSNFSPTSNFGAESAFDPLGVGELKPLAALPVEAERPHQVHAGEARLEGEEDIDAVDAVDAELFPIFEEEGQELLPQLAAKLREWARRPSENAPANACMRTLHTLKGGARLAGAMRLGEMAHRLETRIEHLLAHPPATAADVEMLIGRSDALAQVFEALRARDAQAYADASAAAVSAPLVAPPVAEREPRPEPPAPVVAQPTPAGPVAELPPVVATPIDEPLPLSRVEPAANEPASGVVAELPAIDWSRFTRVEPSLKPAERATGAAQSAVRVRAPLLDRLVNQAGEVSITRSRIESSVGQIKGSLSDLTENLERLRQQLRDIELQAETQMTSRLEQAKAQSQSFDPLEFDRFTRFQELTRMMAESVNDVATVQRTLQRSIDVTEDELAAQARMTRDLQDDLLRTRMVEFEGLSDRLYRVVRLAAKETGKQVRLDIIGGSIEVDRGVLDRMTPAFEHLLRNCVSHGIEAPDARVAAGKDATGTIVVSLTQEGNEVGVEFRDDGRGLDLKRILDKGRVMGLVEPGVTPSDAELANLIFTPGFSTADSVTELAGRGVGMDVVRAEVSAMGGRVETATAPGQGTAFKLILPLTTAVTQVVMLRIGESTVAVPSTLIEIVRRATPAEVEQAYASGVYPFGDKSLLFFWFGALLQLSARPAETSARMRAVLVIRSAQQRIAVHVDEVLGNQEVVVKNLGPQLSRLPGLAGMTLLASGAVALIYNPVALATLYGDAARAMTQAAFASPEQVPSRPVAAEPAEPLAPLVLVVDDSLTVRRVTQRLLVREGYRVALAKDGLEALERLAEERPQVVLSDIEMPRMDGFDLVRNIRGDVRLADLPVIMITSRIAQKHRDYAAQLGVDHYLGKPYSEEDLLALIARYAGVQAGA
jgi:chemosensory pili system protein ChpA (sensor histidine kinase/response regulator)